MIEDTIGCVASSVSNRAGRGAMSDTAALTTGGGENFTISRIGDSCELVDDRFVFLAAY